MRDRVHTAARAALRAAGVGKGDRVVVACSGGGDSVALAHVLVALAGPLELGPVALVCVDHGLRPEGAAEGHAVLALAARLGVVGEVAHATVGPGRGLEDAARHARYAALELARARHGARWIAVGHSADDQAEQVVLALLRGAGTAGLAGIPPVHGHLVRPLLAVRRAGLRAYARGHGLPWAEDPMNQDARFRRARVRHGILPALRAENPRIDDALCRAAAAVRETSSALDAAVDVARVSVVRTASPAGIALDAAALCALPAAVAKRLLSREASARGIALGARHLEALLAVCASGGRSRTLALPGAVAHATGGELAVRLGPGPRRPG